MNGGPFATIESSCLHQGRDHTGRSFNGRTRRSGRRYRGSNPCLPAICVCLRPFAGIHVGLRLLAFSDAARLRTLDSTQPIEAKGIHRDGKDVWPNPLSHNAKPQAMQENGRPIWAVVSAVVDGDTMKVAQMLERSQTIKRGTGSRQK